VQGLGFCASEKANFRVLLSKTGASCKKGTYCKKLILSFLYIKNNQKTTR
jgi:hypothetical protein